MNILFVAECDWFKGVVFDLHILAERMALKGHNVYALDWNLFTDDSGVAVTPGRLYPEAVVRVRRAPVVRNKFLSVTNIATDAVIKAMREWCIDVVVLYSGLVMGCQATIAAKMLKIPVVCRMIDRRAILWPGRYSTWSKWAESFTFRHADLILAITVNYADYVTELGGPRDRIKLLNFPLDLSLFKPSGQHSHDILWLGNLYPFSGLHSLIEQWPEIRAAVPDATFTIVGGGDPQMLTKLTRMAERYDGAIRFTGQVPFRELPALINQAGVCVNLMQGGPGADVYSCKVLQYMACGKPVVSSATPGMMRTIPQGVGVSFCSGDAAAYSIIRIMEHNWMAERMGMAARAWVEQNCDAEKITDEFERHLMEVANG